MIVDAINNDIGLDYEKIKEPKLKDLIIKCRNKNKDERVKFKEIIDVIREW